MVARHAIVFFGAVLIALLFVSVAFAQDELEPPFGFADADGDGVWIPIGKLMRSSGADKDVEFQTKNGV